MTMSRDNFYPKCNDNRSPEEIAEVEDVLFKMCSVIQRADQNHAEKTKKPQRDRAIMALKQFPNASTMQIAKLARVGKTTVLEARIDLEEKRKSA